MNDPENIFFELRSQLCDKECTVNCKKSCEESCGESCEEICKDKENSNSCIDSDCYLKCMSRFPFHSPQPTVNAVENTLENIGDSFYTLASLTDSVSVL